MSKSMRLNDSIFADIERGAAVEHRTPPKQLEYWVKLGKILASQLGPEGSVSLLQGFTRVRLEKAEHHAADMDSVLMRLEQDRSSGALAQKVATTSFRVGVDPTDPNKLAYFDTHGKRKLDLAELPAQR